uniref:Family with sequence similarity 3 member D n=1 Tax=Accipiter nisus TaxID=211598 RepID=A0A8B9RUG2_9AVES
MASAVPSRCSHPERHLAPSLSHPTPSLGTVDLKQEACPSPRTSLLHARSWSRCCPLFGPLCPSASPAQPFGDVASVAPWGQHHGLQLRSSLAGTQLPQHKCGNKKSCPKNHFAFKITSGAANVVGPSICFDDMVLMSSMKNNIGRGLNIALVNGESDINKLDTFLQEIKHGTIVLTASYDDAATKMNDKVRTQFVELGSSHVSKLGFRDNWVFLGAKGLNNKSPFEEHIKNDEKKNKYDGWPEMLELEGCAPRKMD